MDATLRRAAAIVRAGGVVAYATEACFGIGCDPMDRRAVHRVLALKRRSARKGLIVLAASEHQLRPYVAGIPAHVRATWPGPHTWLLPTRSATPSWVRGAHASLAVRITAHRQAAALCRASGMAIISTSANRSGERPARAYREARQRIGAVVDFVLPGRIGRLARPTPIVDAVTGRVIRAG